MTIRAARRLAWGLWAIGVAFALASVVLLAISFEAPTPEGQFGFRGFAAIFAVTFGTVGALIASRLPANPLGWIFVAVGLLSGFQELANQYAIHAILGEGGDLPLAEEAAWIPAWIWIPVTSGTMYLLLLFPDGRLPSPRWRWVVVVGVVGTVTSSVGYALDPGPLENFATVENPFGVRSVGPIRFMAELGLFLYGVAIVLAAISLVIRFRRSRGEERERLKWLAASGILLSLSLALSFGAQIAQGPGPGSNRVTLGVALVVIGGFGSLPIATGIAILRHRLFDIDLVIKKTVIIAVVAVAITFVYLIALVSAAGAVLGGLLVALTYRPMRDAARRIADRLVYGKRATPYEVLTAFSGRMAEGYAAEDALPRMATLLRDATGADVARVWLRVGPALRAVASSAAGGGTRDVPVDGDELPDFEGERGFEVRHRGELLGALSVAMPANDPLDATRERLIRDLAAQAGLVLRNARLVEELRESRRRIVAAQDAERRRIERDIHDGAQQRLVALSVKAKLAGSAASEDPEKAGALMREIQTELSDALEELRDLARGIFPPLLADAGLPAALEAQARKSPVQVAIDPDGCGRYAQEIEAAVYFCVLEALQNVAKYAGASRASVTLSAADGRLRFEVVDDGVGFDPTTVPRGTGLQNMADRLAALGGSLEVSSAPGSGARVTGVVPVEEGA